MTLTFIIPIYNVAPKLLRRALTSLQSLTFQQWMAVVIDDGSTTLDVAQVVSDMHDDRITVHRQDNTGLSAARNTGLDITADEYIMFLDADDYIFAPVIDRLISLAHERRPDVLAFRMTKVYADEPIPAPTHKAAITYEGTGRNYMMRHNVRAAACCYIFRHSLTDDGLRFTQGILHEDEEFTPRLWLRANRFLDTTAVAYAYYQRPHSITHSSDANTFARRLNDIRGIIARLRATGDPALKRRARILKRDMAYNILRHSPNLRFALQQLFTSR